MLNKRAGFTDVFENFVLLRGIGATSTTIQNASRFQGHADEVAWIGAFGNLVGYNPDLDLTVGSRQASCNNLSL